MSLGARISSAWNALTAPPITTTAQVPIPGRGETPAEMLTRLYYTGASLYGGGGSWLGMLRAKDQEIRADMAALRSNSRRLLNNNPFMRRYIRALGTHVVGPKGMRFKSLFGTKDGIRRDPYASKIEAAFNAWGKKGTATVCGKFSWVKVVRMAIRIAALDGECFIRIVRGAPNKFGFALQFLDADLLNHMYTRLPDPMYSNNSIVMGVELNEWDRPVAYHFTTPAAARNTWPVGPVVRIPAEDIIHIYDPERANQTRGVPWVASSMYLLSMLGHYWEAEVALARHESERPGFIKSAAGLLDEDGVDLDREGTTPQVDPRDVASMMPQGTGIAYLGVPAGCEIDIPDVKHPTTAFADFSKAMIKGMSSGMGVGYASLSNDLTQVSFSSIRQGTLEDREYYQELQQDLIETLCERVVNEFLPMAVLKSQLKMPSGATFDQFASHKFTPRGWDWVDPKSDMMANVGKINAGLGTRTRVLAEQGEDFAEMCYERQEEDALLESLGIVLTPPPKSASAETQETDSEGAIDEVSPTNSQESSGGSNG